MEPLRERFDAVPESVPRARHVATEYVRSLGADEACLQSVQLAVIEAAANAARHAYSDSSGSFELSACHERQSEVEIVVRDQGRGHETVSPNAGAGFGIPLMRDAASEFMLASGPAGGTEVRMRFPLHDRETSAR